MKILVTGGCGFIGANLIPMLEKAGHRIKVLDNLSRGKKEYLNGSDAEIIVGDIRNSSAVSDALVSVDAVIHLAAYGSVVESVWAPEENFDINVKGTFVVLDECRKRDVKRLVFASTGGALIGDAIPPVNESSLPKPISPYGSSKLCGEAYCSSFAASYGMDITATRFANVIGPISRHKKGAVTAFFKAIMDGKPITIYGDGSATRDFLHVADLCNGILLALDTQLSRFEVFHLASGREVSILELANLAVKASGRKEYAINFEMKRKGEVEKNFAEYYKAQDKLNFKVKYTLEQGLLETWEWFVSNKIS